VITRCKSTKPKSQFLFPTLPPSHTLEHPVRQGGVQIGKLVWLNGWPFFTILGELVSKMVILPKIGKSKSWGIFSRVNSTLLRNACWELFCFLFSRKSSCLYSASPFRVGSYVWGTIFGDWPSWPILTCFSAGHQYIVQSYSWPKHARWKGAVCLNVPLDYIFIMAHSSHGDLKLLSDNIRFYTSFGRASGGLEHGIQPDGQMPSDKTLSLI